MIADMPTGVIKISMAEFIAGEATADITNQAIGMDAFILKNKVTIQQS